MRLKLTLSESGINRVINRLNRSIDNIEQGVSDFVDIMVTDGAEVANIAYGSMATAWGHRDSETDASASGHIGVTAEDEHAAIIAEFGAGDDTMEVIDFENPPPVPVYAGAYSELVGSGDYATKGYWYFRGQKYYGEGGRRVEPRHGLLNAKAHIISSAEDIAQEVIRL